MVNNPLATPVICFCFRLHSLCDCLLILLLLLRSFVIDDDDDCCCFGCCYCYFSVSIILLRKIRLQVCVIGIL